MTGFNTKLLATAAIAAVLSFGTGTPAFAQNAPGGRQQAEQVTDAQVSTFLTNALPRGVTLATATQAQLNAALRSVAAAHPTIITRIAAVAATAQSNNPQAIASIAATVSQIAPQQAASIAAAMSQAVPQQAAAITSAIITTVPAQAVSVASAVMQVVPPQTRTAIISAALRAAPRDAAIISSLQSLAIQQPRQNQQNQNDDQNNNSFPYISEPNPNQSGSPT